MGRQEDEELAGEQRAFVMTRLITKPPGHIVHYCHCWHRLYNLKCNLINSKLIMTRELQTKHEEDGRGGKKRTHAHTRTHLNLLNLAQNAVCVKTREHNDDAQIHFGSIWL